jgi:Zn-dependent oligopeptidase
VVPGQQRTYENTLLALEEAGQILADAKPWTFLAHIAPDDELREAARA